MQASLNKEMVYSNKQTKKDKLKKKTHNKKQEKENPLIVKAWMKVFHGLFTCSLEHFIRLGLGDFFVLQRSASVQVRLC